MDVLRFDSRQPNARYAGLIELLREKLTQVLVVAKPAATITPPTQAAVAYAAFLRRVRDGHPSRWAAA